MLPSSKLLQEEPTGSRVEANTIRDPSSGLITAPPPAMDNANDDDPPPYTAIAPPNHVGWAFNFSEIPYSAYTATPYRTEVPLAPFQTSLTSNSAFQPEGTDSQYTSISMPLMPCRLFKFGSHRSLFAHRGLPISDDESVTKDHGRTRRYGAILVAAAVIIFLMVLSLLVRFVMDKSFWRG